MATKLVALSNKNWSDSTWRKTGQCFVSSGGQQAAGPAYSPVWNGNGNVDYGAIIFYQGASGANITLVLQELVGGTTWTDRVSVTINGAYYGFVQGTFNSTHTETVGASNYRLKMSQTGGNSWWLACTGGAWCCIMIDDETGISPVDGDLVFIFATVTIDDAAPADIICGDDNATIIAGGVGGSGGGSCIVGVGGKLEYLYTATVDHTFKIKGDLKICKGTLEIGTAANPIPATRQFEIRLNYSASMADYKYGFSVDAGGTATLQGASRAISALLSGDEAAGQTELGLSSDVSADWKSGENVVIAGTSRAANQSELRTLASDAAADHIDITAGLTNAHAGASPSRCDVISMYRNVRVVPANTTNETWTKLGDTSIVDFDYVYFSYAGTSGSSRYGAITIDTTTGSCDIRYCVIDRSTHSGLYITSAASNNITLKYNCIYNYNFYGIAVASATTGTTIDISYNILIGSQAMNSASFWLLDFTITCTHNVSSSGYQGFEIREAVIPTAFSDNFVYAMTDAAFYFYNSARYFYTFSNLTAWRTYYGINLNGSWYLTFNTFKAWGNYYAGYSVGEVNNITFNDCEFSGETSLTGNEEFLLGAAVHSFEFYRCKFGAISGARTAKTQTFRFYNSAAIRQIYAENCTFGDTNIIESSPAYFQEGSWLRSHNHGNVSGRHLTLIGYTTGGLLGILEDHVTGGQAAGWARGGSGTALIMDPKSTTRALEWKFAIPCTNATPVQCKIYVRKTAGSPTLSFSAKGSGITPIVNASVTLTTDWAQYVSDAMIPTEDGFIEITLKALDNASSGDIGIDDISQ